ncbi:hypothetical protein OnM2_068013 [Erysiphe neolycopersici]|uniref:Uncharacterized protein n=1 Tax=Erysiphe neolycopersici TaxID=212602 RepID=A0A420HLI2_9PEZI|nr:hypothetical protein OnM2_068013 [Erysiphe neolycopersici]
MYAHVLRMLLMLSVAIIRPFILDLINRAHMFGEKQGELWKNMKQASKHAKKKVGGKGVITPDVSR